MFDKIFELLKLIIPLLSDKMTRLRIYGYRIQVTIAIVSYKEQTVLLGQSGGGKNWILPQEGVNIKQPFEDALYSCLEVECGISLPKDKLELRRIFYYRGTQYLGKTKLPPTRRGSRPVADNAAGTIFENVKLRGKAFWLACLVVNSQDKITPIPDGIELIALKWLSIEDAKILIKSTCRKEKAELLIRALDIAKKQIGGVSNEF